MKDTPEVMTEPAVEAEPRLSVPTAVLDATLEYLAKQPYKEVYQLVSAIQTGAKEI